ncbi:zinc finger and BTB domain-containing protein 14 isoform X2 [Coccinella septempunctata]|uniref:zinc finger and BTB domain-containing protein 14 isoform X2 n=1 Tax=Coccinella septempunctata TaxID=41139 RepID=UPI001D077017|nr:zinc finger and BTB domain-containing protein 14 isoform X2 [Coccinella septempunctata]
MALSPPQQFCVRWNSYQSNLQNAFPKLLNSEHFVDVTLACENEMLKCHKVVLSACSTYFEKLLLHNPCQHPIIFMKDMKFHEMQSLIDFMYKGEVNVSQDDLPSLLKSAEALQIRGLCGSDQIFGQQNFVKTQLARASAAVAAASSQAASSTNPGSETDKAVGQEHNVKSEKTEEMECNQSASESDSNDALQIREDTENVKEEPEVEESYYEGESEILDTEFIEGEGTINTGVEDKATPMNAMANVSCHYDGTPVSGSSAKRIRRTDEELRRAAECITRGQTFQNVSDQFSIPISTIRFYMARKGILPRRKRGRACSGAVHVNLPSSGYSPNMYTGNPNHITPGNTSPVGPPYHIVHYKLSQLGVSKLK